MTEIIKEELLNYEGKIFLHYQQNNRQAVTEMKSSIRKMFAENNLSIVEAKGFLDYMKLIVEFNPCTLLNEK